jgi:hypothetical protein
MAQRPASEFAQQIQGGIDEARRRMAGPPAPRAQQAASPARPRASVSAS